MKKMMTMMAIVLVAGLSQAAAVQWATGVIKTPTPGTGVPTATSVTDANGPWTVLALFWAADGTTAITGLTGDTDTTHNLGAYSATTSDSFTGGLTYWGQLQINKNDGTWTRSTTKVSFVAPGTGNQTFNTTTFTWDANWTAVPEPTSMALLALGAAAIGLRRKFRK